MDGLITASSTRRTAKPEPQLTPALSAAPSQRNEDLIVKSADDALRILQSEPSRDALFECLQWLTESSKVEGGSDIRIPSPMAAQLINSLVNDIIPVYWNKLSKEDDLRDPGLQKALLYCLKSVAGIGAVSMRFRNLIASQSQDATEKGESMVKGGNSSLLGEYLQLLEGILEGDNFVERLWNNMKRSVESQLKRTMLWKELISWLATGKILSISAEAAAVYRNASTTVDDFWVSDGKAYTSWLGRNIVSMGYNDTLDEEGNKAKTQLFSKALFLGFTGKIFLF